VTGDSVISFVFVCDSSRPFGPVPMVPGGVDGGPGVGLPLGAFAGSLQKLSVGGSHPDSMMQFMTQPPPQQMIGGTGGMMFDGPTFEPIHIDPIQVDYQNPMLASAESPAYTLDYAQQVCVSCSRFLCIRLHDNISVVLFATRC